MAKNIEHIQHVKSSVVLEGKPKLPQPSVLVEGELAINYADGVETISIKNSNGDIVTFSSDLYYTEQKLGTGFTGENSANTVTDLLDLQAEITASALNDLNTNKLDVTAYTPTDLSNYYTKSETSGASEISTALNGKSDTGHTHDDRYYTKSETSGASEISTALSNYYTKSETSGSTELSTEFGLYVKKADVDQTIDSSTSASTGAVSTSAVYDFVTAFTPAITVDQVIDETTSASTNPISTSAVYSAITDNEFVWANAYAVISGAISSHTENTNVHVTSADKTAWNGKANASHTHEASAVTAMTGYQVASTSASILTTDSLLEAIAKLEKRIELLENQV